MAFGPRGPLQTHEQTQLYEMDESIDVPSLVADIDIFSAARTVVMFLFAMDVDLLLELLVAGREIGLCRERVLTFPSDALLLW